MHLESRAQYAQNGQIVRSWCRSFSGERGLDPKLVFGRRAQGTVWKTNAAQLRAFVEDEIEVDSLIAALRQLQNGRGLNSAVAA